MEGPGRSALRAIAPRSQDRRRRSAALGLLILATGCGRIAFDAVADADLAADGAASVCHTGTFSPPALITTLSDPATDWAPALSSDGNTLYFSSFRSGPQELYVSTRVLGVWSAPIEISELSLGAGEEGNPSISRDQLELYWGETHIYRAIRASTTSMWGAGQLVQSDTASFTEEQGPDISADGQTLYFTAVKTGAPTKSLWQTSRTGNTFTAPTLISELDTSVDEGWPAVTADELEIFYTSYGAAAATTQLQHASRSAKTDPWTPLGAVPELDGLGADDDDATVSADGSTLVFASNRNGGNFEIYTATRSCD